MITISITEKRAYFRSFKCEVLTSDPQNKELIANFSSKKANNTLEDYLKDEHQAWAEDSDGETRVYLIKDESGEIAFYFSIKCGLLIGENSTSKLPDDEREFVDIVVEAIISNNIEAKKAYYEDGSAVYADHVDSLFEIAMSRAESKKDAAATGQDAKWNVERCVSAIELRHFCRNENYSVPDNLGVSLGFGLFWEQIVPLVLEITQRVGCKYLYLFAADNTEAADDPNLKTLVRYYKNTLKFYECDEDDLIIVKPAYDNFCYGLIQEIDKLGSNRENVWLEYADVL